MKSIKTLVCFAALGTIAVLSNAGAAHAFRFNVTTGVAGPNGETDRGAFSEFSGRRNTRTITFDNGAPTSGFATYSFQKGTNSSVRSDVWAPAGPNGEVNATNYLAVFAGDSVTIQLTETLNYFGINWGAISPGNVFSFFRGDRLVQSYSTEDINPVAPVRARQHSNEGNGFVHFYADSRDEIFDKIVITQTGGGGFESDNHSFHIGDDAFTEKVPEPSVAIGLAVMSGLLLKRRQKKEQLS